MDQAYGGTGSSRYYIATAFQDVRTYVRGFAFAIDGGERLYASWTGLTSSPIKWQFLKHGA